MVEIACPSDCQYLSAARAHPPAVVQRQQARDLRFLLPRIEGLSEVQYRLLLFFQAAALQHARQAVPSPRDADIAEGAASVAATIETARKGIIYQHQATSLPAQRLADDLGRALADLTQKAGAEAGRLERDAAKALRTLQDLANAAEKELPDAGDLQGSWLAFAARVTGTDGSRTDAEDGPAGAGDRDAPRIIVP